MQVSFLIPGDLATPTGGYGYARRLLRAFPKQGIDAAHMTLPGTFPTPDGSAQELVADVLKTLPAGQPLLLDGLAGGALAPKTLRAAKGPVVILCHHPLALEAGLSEDHARRLRDSEHLALSYAEHVITTSHATGAILTRDYGVAREKLTVAPPGTDPAPQAEANGPCRLLSVGSLTRRKRHDLLIAALAELRDHEWTLRVAGPAPDAEVRAELLDQIERLNLSDRVSLIGTLSTAELAAAYQSSDMFVLASEYEGFGMAYTEAMSHGLPTLGIQCAAVEEATAGGAMLTDDAMFSTVLASLLASKAERNALAQRCWTTAQTFLRWDQTTAIVASVLKKVAS